MVEGFKKYVIANGADHTQTLDAILDFLEGNSWQLRTLHALRKCRTAALGGHIDRCDNPKCRVIGIVFPSVPLDML
jgi:hypothetical protein